jgi:O-antigen ligase
MASSSRSISRSQFELAADAPVPSTLRRVVSITFWSPLVFLTALIHFLCQPRTKRVLIGIVVLDIPLHWGKHFDFNPNAASLGALSGFDISITTFALFALYLGWFFAERVNGRWPYTIWSWPIAAYTAVLLLSLFVASVPRLALVQIALMTQMLALYVYLAGNIRSRRDVLFILRLFLAGGLLESAYILVLAISGHEFAVLHVIGFESNLFLPSGSAILTRPGGTVGSPNFAAAYLAILITLAVAIRRMNVPSSLRRLTIPTIVLAGLALIATLSRGGWIELLLSIAVFAGATWLRNGISHKALLAIAAAVLLFFSCLYIPNPVSHRIFADDNGAAHSRLPLMHLAYHIIAANPLLGVGANNFAAVMNDYAGSEFRSEWIYTVHNQFLLVCSETGLIGLAAYLWIFVALIRNGWRLWATGSDMWAPMGLGIVAAIFGLIAHMCVDIFDDRAILEVLWMFVALVGTCELIRRAELAAQSHSPARDLQLR